MTIEDAIRAAVRAEVRAALAEVLAEVRASGSAAASEWVPESACGLRRTTARRLRREGAIRSARIGREVLVHAGDVARYIAGRASTSPRPDGADEFDRALRVVGGRQ